MVFHAMASTAAWGADLLATRSKGRQRGVYYVDLGGGFEDLPSGWAFLGYGSRPTLLRDISRIIFKSFHLQIEGMVRPVVEWKEARAAECEVDLLSMCWCRDHEASGAQPFFLVLPPDALAELSHAYGSLFAPELLRVAKEATDVLTLDGSESFDQCALSGLGTPGSQSWLEKVGVATNKARDRQNRERQRASDRTAVAAIRERERLLQIESECADLDGLVRRYRGRIPPDHLMLLVRVNQPPAGPLTNAILLSWMRSKDSLPEIRSTDALYWPSSLRLLVWTLRGQESAVLKALSHSGPAGRAAVDEIARLSGEAKAKLQSFTGVGYSGGAGIAAGILRTWASLVP